MDVLIVFLKEDREKVTRFEEELNNLEIRLVPYMIPREGDKKTFDLLQEMEYLLVINNPGLIDDPWFIYLSGYLLGKDCHGVIAGDGLKKSAFKVPGWKFLKNKADLVKYFRIEKEHWDKNFEIEKAGKELVKKGYNLNEDSMVFALMEGDLDAVSLFLIAGFSPEGCDGRGTPLLSIAAGRGYLEIMELLLKAGAEVDRFSRTRHNSALMDAAAEGRTEAVRILVSAGAKLDYRSRNGQTALILAVGQKYTETAKFLIESGADPSIKDELGMSCESYAKLFNLKELQELFKEAG